jgi:hypothetical protein
MKGMQMKLRHMFLVLLSAIIVVGCAVDPEKVYQLRYAASALEISAAKNHMIDQARFSYDRFSVQSHRAINEEFGDELSEKYDNLRTLTGFVVEFRGTDWIYGTSESIRNRCNANFDRTDYDCKSYTTEEFKRCEYGLEYRGQGDNLYAVAVLYKFIAGDVEVPEIMWPSTSGFCIR